MKPIILLTKLCKEDYWYGPRSKKHNFQGITQELHDKCIEDINYVMFKQISIKLYAFYLLSEYIFIYC